MNVKKHVETDSYEIKLVKSAILATQLKKLLYQSKEQNVHSHISFGNVANFYNNIGKSTIVERKYLLPLPSILLFRNNFHKVDVSGSLMRFNHGHAQRL